MACPRPEAESVLERCGVFFSVLFCFGGVGVTGCFGRQPVISHLGASCFQKFMLSLPWGSAYIFLSQSHTATPSLFFSGYQFLADNEALQDSPSTSCFPGSLVSQPKHPTRVLGTELLLARVHGGIWRPCCHHFGRKTEKEKSLLSPAEADLQASQILLCVCNFGHAQRDVEGYLHPLLVLQILMQFLPALCPCR